MMANIVDLDGIALHAYTHGYTPDLITSLETFRDDPLRWQYYHFRCYTTFLDALPPRHRNKPIFITETDPHGPTPWAGGRTDGCKRHMRRSSASTISRTRLKFRL